MEKEYITWPADKEDLIEVSLYTGDSPISSHKHDYVEIVFIVQGSCLHSYIGSEVTLIPGDIFTVVPHEEHSYIMNSRTVLYNCLFYPEALDGDWKALKEIGGIFDFLMVEPIYREELKRQEILHLKPLEILHIEALLKNMIEEETNRQTGFQFVQKANLIKLLVFIGRVWEKQLFTQKYTYNRKREMLAEAIQYIEQNMNGVLKINELASRVYLSPQYFRKVFREVTDLTPIEYINKIRISKASELLVKKNFTVSMVAEIVGINDVNYFSRLFRTITGYTPSEFRKKNDLC